MFVLYNWIQFPGLKVNLNDAEWCARIQIRWDPDPDVCKSKTKARADEYFHKVPIMDILYAPRAQ